MDPWSRRIPRVLEQLSPCTTTIEPALQSPGVTTTEPTPHNDRSPCILELVFHKRSHCNESLHTSTREQPLLATTKEMPV